MRRALLVALVLALAVAAVAQQSITQEQFQVFQLKARLWDYLTVLTQGQDPLAVMQGQKSQIEQLQAQVDSLTAVTQEVVQ